MNKQEELAKIFQYWLDINEKSHKADGNIVTDEMHVYPTEYPTRKVLREWIKILTEK